MEISLAENDFDRVRKYAESLLAMHVDSQPALEALATAAFAGSDFAGAIKYCEALVRTAPDHFESWFNLGVAHQKLGDFKRAAEGYSQAARLRPKSVEAHLDLGIVLQKLGDLSGARAAYEKALQLDQKLPGAIWNLALVLEQQGETNAAERLYAMLPEDNSDSAEASFRIGYLRLIRGDFRGGAEAFSACLKKPGHAGAKPYPRNPNWRRTTSNPKAPEIRLITAPAGYFDAGRWEILKRWTASSCSPPFWAPLPCPTLSPSSSPRRRLLSLLPAGAGVARRRSSPSPKNWPKSAARAAKSRLSSKS